MAFSDLMPHLLPTLFGLVGVLVGGGISFGTQFYFLKREERRIRAHHVSALLFKLKNICDDLFTASQTIRKALPEKPRGQLWNHMRTVIGIDLRDIDFTPEELSVLKSDDNVQVQSFLILSSQRRRAIHTLLKEYGDLRRLHEEATTRLTRIDPNKEYQRVILNTADHPHLVMNTLQLNAFSHEIIDMLNEFFSELLLNQKKLVAVCRETTGSKIISFDLPDKDLGIDVSAYPQNFTSRT